jgi:hypothetical protein
MCADEFSGWHYSSPKGEEADILLMAFIKHPCLGGDVILTCLLFGSAFAIQGWERGGILVLGRGRHIRAN